MGVKLVFGPFEFQTKSLLFAVSVILKLQSNYVSFPILICHFIMLQSLVFGRILRNDVITGISIGFELRRFGFKSQIRFSLYNRAMRPKYSNRIHRDSFISDVALCPFFWQDTPY